MEQANCSTSPPGVYDTALKVFFFSLARILLTSPLIIIFVLMSGLSTSKEKLTPCMAWAPWGRLVPHAWRGAGGVWVMAWGWAGSWAAGSLGVPSKGTHSTYSLLSTPNYHTDQTHLQSALYNLEETLFWVTICIFCPLFQPIFVSHH